MDSRAKQRLTGAVILVALFVLLVPELLTGPRVADTSEGAPTDEGMRRYTIDLDASAPPAQPDSAAAQAPVALPPVADDRAQPGEAAGSSCARAGCSRDRRRAARRTAEAARRRASQFQRSRRRRSPQRRRHPLKRRRRRARQLRGAARHLRQPRKRRPTGPRHERQGFRCLRCPIYQRRARALSGTRRTDARPGRGGGPGCTTAAHRPVGQHRADFVNSGSYLAAYARKRLVQCGACFEGVAA